MRSRSFSHTNGEQTMSKFADSGESKFLDDGWRKEANDLLSSILSDGVMIVSWEEAISQIEAALSDAYGQGRDDDRYPC
jgi:hypothetical protein